MATELKVTPELGTTQQNDVRLTGFITVGATGAITNQGSTSGQPCGVTWVRNAAGDYRGTLHRGYKRAINGTASIVMPAAGTIPTLAAGNDAFLQGITAANFMGTSPISTVAISCCNSSTDALADPTNGVTITYEVQVSDL